MAPCIQAVNVDCIRLTFLPPVDCTHICVYVCDLVRRSAYAYTHAHTIFQNQFLFLILAITLYTHAHTHRVAIRIRAFLGHYRLDAVPLSKEFFTVTSMHQCVNVCVYVCVCTLCLCIEDTLCLGLEDED